ncbi:MAG: SpoIID/LytB domain-containing protein [Rhodothermales bacterium]|nr:SpoIID/LytB domain-containing protein [Rhodothermales bacterium]
MPISTGLDGTRLRVGIVLREDRQTAVSFGWDSDSSPDSSVRIPPGVRSLDVGIQDGSLLIATGDDTVIVETLTLRTDDNVQILKPGDGLAVEPTRTGRGFHWQKDISVTLPGTLTVAVEEGVLVVINTVDVESYVACVATSEMGAAAPSELLAAQTVVARCWSLALVEQKHAAEGFDVCNDDCCQRYHGSTYVNPHSIKAARDTAGRVLAYDGRVIDARYSKNCGGLVEDYTAVWDGLSVPYLIPLWDSPSAHGEAHFDQFDSYFGYDDAFCAPVRFEGVDLQAMLGKVDETGSYYRWQSDLKLSVLRQNLANYYRQNWNSIDGLDINSRGASARINHLVIRGRDDDGKPVAHELKSEYAIRQMFSESFLYSSAFEVLNSETFREDGYLRLRGCGWGHGVGLCQMGALGMALSGYSADAILEHYYPGTELRLLD